MEAYKIYRKGKTDEEYTEELESICDNSSIPNADHTGAEYAWKAVIAVTTFAGQKAIVSVIQSRRFPSGNEPELRGSIRAYVYTPHTQYSGNGFTLESFDAESAAIRETKRGGSIRKDDVQKRAQELFSQWWNSAVSKVLVAPQGESFDIESDAEELSRFEDENFEQE